MKIPSVRGQPSGHLESGLRARDWRSATERIMNAALIVVITKVAKLALEIFGMPEGGMLE